MNEKELSLVVDPQFDNLSPAQLYEDAIRLGDGEITSNSTLIGPRADHRATCFSVVQNKVEKTRNTFTIANSHKSFFHSKFN